MKMSPLFAACLAAMFTVPAPAEVVVPDIVFTEGVADLTFFYDRPAERFDVVFRATGSTVASGLTNPYSPPVQNVGGGNDFSFNKLSLIVTNPGELTLNGRDYLATTGPSGTVGGGRPDLGTRTRFREQAFDFAGNPVVTFDQFQTFRMTLDWANSVKPDGAEFALWNVDPFGNPNIVHFETASGNLVSDDFAVWGHAHWNYGFSEPGEYDLAFTVQGLGGIAGDTNIGTFSLGITAVPEPMTAGLLAFGVGCMVVGGRYRSKGKSQSEAESIA